MFYKLVLLLISIFIVSHLEAAQILKHPQVIVSSLIAPKQTALLNDLSRKQMLDLLFNFKNSKNKTNNKIEELGKIQLLKNQEKQRMEQIELERSIYRNHLLSRIKDTSFKSDFLPTRF